MLKNTQDIPSSASTAQVVLCPYRTPVIPAAKVELLKKISFIFSTNITKSSPHAMKKEKTPDESYHWHELVHILFFHMKTKYCHKIRCYCFNQTLPFKHYATLSPITELQWILKDTFSFFSQTEKATG